MNGRVILAGMLIVGIMVLTGFAMQADIKDGAKEIVNTSMGGLILALGVAAQGIFRTDKADETRAENTGKAFDMGLAGIAATPAPEKESL